MVDYNTGPTFLDRVNKNRAASQQSRLRDIQMRSAESELDAAQAERRKNRDIDAAQRRAVQENMSPQAAQKPQPGMSQPQSGGMPMSEPGWGGAPAPQAPQPRRPAGSGFRRSLAQHLSGVEGGGELAVKYGIQDADREMDVALKTFQLAVENPDAAEAFAAQNGYQIPPQVRNLIRNREMSGAIAQAIARANDLFKGNVNVENKMKYIQNFIAGLNEQAKAQGGISPQQQQGMSSSGPMPTVPQTLKPVTTMGPGGKPTIGNFDPQTGDVSPGTVQGYGSGTGGAGRKSVFQLKYDAWLSQNPGDEQGALDYASGRSQMSPQQAMAAARRIAAGENIYDRDLLEQRVQEIFRSIMTAERPTDQPAGPPAAGAPTPGGAPAPAPGAPAAGQPLPPPMTTAEDGSRAFDVSKLVDGQEYLIGGDTWIWSAQQGTFFQSEGQ